MTDNSQHYYDDVTTGAGVTETMHSSAIATTAQRNTFFNSNANESKRPCKQDTTDDLLHTPPVSEQTLSQPAMASSHSDLTNSAATSDARYLTTEQLVIRISFFHTQFTPNIKHI